MSSLRLILTHKKLKSILSESYFLCFLHLLILVLRAMVRRIGRMMQLFLKLQPSKQPIKECKGDEHVE